MTNLAAAVELVAKWCRESSEWKADKRKQLIPSHFDLGRIKALDQCAAELKTILAELGRGAGEPVYMPHKFWGAGESDCPADIKSSNGELHTLRCKVCGKDNNKDPCSVFMAPQIVADAEPFGFYNLAAKTYIRGEEYAATEFNQDLLDAGKVIRLYTRPPVAGLAELTDEQWYSLWDAMDDIQIPPCNFKDTIELKAAMAKAAREFLGKVDG